MTAPPAAARVQMLDLLSGFMKSQCVSAAARLGICDLVETEPRDARAVAEALDADLGAVRRFLRALASVGVLAALGHDRYAKTELSSLLCDRPGSMRDIAVFFSQDCFVVWDGFLDAVKTGACTWHVTHGENHFTSLERDPAAGERFHRAMSAGAGMLVDLLASLEWKDAKKVVDVGGGSGALLAGLLERHPHLDATVFDLPHVVQGRPQGGVRFAGGDAFHDPPPEADVYVYSRVLHDWPDDAARTILATCRRAAKIGARLVVLERALPDDRPGDPSAHLLDMQMLVMTGGKERMASEWRTLFASAGFELGPITPGPIVAAIEARAV